MARERQGLQVRSLHAAREVIANADMLIKKSIWIFGGDGWAYDIGYGGLDHVLAQGRGRQRPGAGYRGLFQHRRTGVQGYSARGAVAKFAAAGKRTKKKDLGMMAMSYGYVYVAQVAMGADPAQLLKAHDRGGGVSRPVPHHRLRSLHQPRHQDESGAAGDPARRLPRATGRPIAINPTAEKKFTLDSKDPTASYQDFIRGENRYATLLRQFPDVAPTLFEESEEDAAARLENYKRLAEEE